MNRKGFSLVELTVVLTVMAILLAMAAPSIVSMHEKPYLSAMRTDLSRLGEAQEKYKLAHGDYAGSIGRSNVEGAGGAGVVAFRSSMGSVVTLAYVDSLGWGATITNPVVNTPVHDVCGIYVGPSSYYAAAAGLTLTTPELTPRCH
jgi:prepilin-type N-terminal cleavage/methylation domain-containing protein